MALSAEIPLPLLLFGPAALYTSVGHAGASAYLASMALAGLAPEVMRPTALVLNIVVASFSAVRFWRAGLIDPRLALWLVAGAAPLAFLGGAIKLPGEIYRPPVGVLPAVAATPLPPPGRTTTTTGRRGAPPDHPAGGEPRERRAEAASALARGPDRSAHRPPFRADRHGRRHLPV